jgi:hypothetical protein
MEYLIIQHMYVDTLTFKDFQKVNYPITVGLHSMSSVLKAYWKRILQEEIPQTSANHE